MKGYIPAFVQHATNFLGARREGDLVTHSLGYTPFRRGKATSWHSVQRQPAAETGPVAVVPRRALSARFQVNANRRVA
jgi:hypothetical protein